MLVVGKRVVARLVVARLVVAQLVVVELVIRDWIKLVGIGVVKIVVHGGEHLLE